LEPPETILTEEIPPLPFTTTVTVTPVPSKLDVVATAVYV